MTRYCPFLALFIYLSLIFSVRAKSADTAGFKSLIRKSIAFSSTATDSALHYAHKALGISLASGIDSLIVLSNYTFGEIYLQSRNYHLALDYNFKALEWLEKTPPERMASSQLKLMVNLDNRIGICYFMMEMPEQGMEYSQRAIQKLREVNELAPGTFSLQSIMFLTFNIGSLHIGAGNWDLARDYFDEVAMMNAELNDSTFLREYYNNYGIYYKEKGMMDLALESYQRALDISQHNNDLPGIARVHNNLGEFYKINGNKELAIRHFSTAIEAGQRASAWKSVKNSQ
ncbi:MAG: tetratricopeptide repeat protein [Bacteroidales bacterium]|nr:tetratricopeptide repeat protein [Bacteroidales bacterium]